MVELRKIVKITAVLTVVLATASCASAGDPWEPGEHAAQAAAARAEPTRMCDVRIENETGETLELFYSVGGLSERLDETPTGRFHVVGVPCSSKWIRAYGFGNSRPGEGKGRFARRVKLDVLKQTVLRLTGGDRVR